MPRSETDRSCHNPMFNFFFLAMPHGMWDLSSLTRDWTLNPCPLHWKCGVLTTRPPGKSPLWLTFWGVARLFPKRLPLFTFPLAVCRGSKFSTSLTTLLIVWLFDNSHPSECKVASHCGFDLYFPNANANNIENIFMWLLAICISSLEKCLFRFFIHFQMGLSFYYWVVSVLYIFDV